MTKEHNMTQYMPYKLNSVLSRVFMEGFADFLKGDAGDFADDCDGKYARAYQQGWIAAMNIAFAGKGA